MARRIALWAGVGALLVIGFAAATVRTVHVGDAGVRLELLRREVLPATSRLVPDADARLQDVAAFDARFGRHPLVTRVHTIGGLMFLVLAPLQFAGPLRRRFTRVHRWTGRVLLGLGLFGAVSGLYFGLLMPFSGPLESVVIALAGGLFLFAMARAFLAIRAGEVALHREWMIRMFAVAIGISSIRVVGAILDGVLTPVGFSMRQILALSLWLGWLLTVAAAEIWIRRSRYSLETRLA